METKTNKTNTTIQEMTETFTLWKKQSKSGKTYFTGKDKAGDRITGFFVTNKKNPKEPDLKIYYHENDGTLAKEPILSLWCNVSKNEKKYLFGKIGSQKYVGFITKDTKNDKRPYVRVYVSTEQEQKKTTEEAPF